MVPGVHAFLVGADGQLYHAAGSGPGALSAFASLGGSLSADPVAVGREPDGRLHLFARGTDSALRSTTPRVAGRSPRAAAAGCSRRSLVKRNVKSTKISLAALTRRPLRVGTTITITVSAPGTIGAVKTLRIRSRHAPAVTTRCLPPGAAKPTRC